MVWYCDVEFGEYVEFFMGDKLREYIKIRYSVMIEFRVVRKVICNILCVIWNVNICLFCN